MCCKCCQSILETIYWHLIEKNFCYDESIALYEDPCSKENEKNNNMFDNLAFYDSVAKIAGRAIVTIDPLPDKNRMLPITRQPEPQPLTNPLIFAEDARTRTLPPSTTTDQDTRLESNLKPDLPTPSSHLSLASNQTTVPVLAAKLPVAEATMTVLPVSSSLELGANSPVYEANSPVYGASPPVAEARQPLSEGKQPISEAVSPVCKINRPASESSSPVFKANQPVYEANPPVYEANPPVSDARLPVSDAKLPVFQHNQPVSADKSPVFKATQSVSEANLPVAEAKLPVCQLNEPVCQINQPVSEARTPLFDVNSPAPVFESKLLEVEINVPVSAALASRLLTGSGGKLLVTAGSSWPGSEANLPALQSPNSQLLATAESTVPLSGSNLPVSGVNVPVSEVNVPVSEVNVPVSEVNVPVSEVNVPVSEVNVPVSEVNMPVSEVNVPVSKVNLPVSDANLPALEARLLEWPNSKLVVTTGSSLPVSGSSLAVSGSNLPVSESDMNVSGGNGPVLEVNLPVSEGKLGVDGTSLRRVGEELPKLGEAEEESDKFVDVPKKSQLARPACRLRRKSPSLNDLRPEAAMRGEHASVPEADADSESARRRKKSLRERRMSKSLSLNFGEHYELPVIRQSSVPKFYLDTPSDIEVSDSGTFRGPSCALASPIRPARAKFQFDLRSVVQMELERVKSEQHPELAPAKSGSRLAVIRERLRPLKIKRHASASNLPRAASFM